MTVLKRTRIDSSLALARLHVQSHTDASLESYRFAIEPRHFGHVNFHLIATSSNIKLTYTVYMYMY
jgi:hypothetical protein